MLQPGPGGYTSREVDRAELVVEDAVQRIKLVAPPPPTGAELMRRRE